MAQNIRPEKPKNFMLEIRKITWVKKAIEKFAELIVKDCVSMVKTLSPGYDDYRNQIEDAFRRDCVEKIKEQFEVNDG